MKSIWVIEEGSYSDYHVVGVFTTKERAQAVLDAMGGGDDTSIAKWPLDPWIEELNHGLHLYHVCMDIDGNTEEIGRAKDSYSFRFAELEIRERSTWSSPRPDAVEGEVWAKDDAHAIKIANEFRTRAIAEGKMNRRA